MIETQETPFSAPDLAVSSKTLGKAKEILHAYADSQEYWLALVDGNGWPFFEKIIRAPYWGAPAEKGKAAASTVPRAFERDQSKFFRDVPHGDRHARLRAVGVAIRCETRANAAKIADAMRWHAARFSEPLDDEKWIERTAKSIERSF